LRKTFINVDVDSDEVGTPTVLSMSEFIEDGADGPAIDIDCPASSEDAKDKEDVDVDATGIT
jgi:hypothetical protein